MATKDEKLATIHSDALAEFDEIQMAVREERTQCLEDRRFCSIAGAQWEGDLEKQFENKPKYEINKIHLAVIRIFNEYRNNQISIEFVPRDGQPADDLADATAGLYRADEQDSCAEEAHDNAFDEGVMGGMGAWRVRAKHQDDEDENEDIDEDERLQSVYFEPIHDADSCVFWNLDAKRQDKSDAKTCYVLTPMSLAAHKAEYNDDPASWPAQITKRFFDWATPTTVFVAELYKMEKVNVTFHWFRGLDGKDIKLTHDELDEEKLNELKATGFNEVRKRTVKKSKCHKYIMNGARVLEDCGIIAGKHIPIIMFYGKRWVVDGTERCMGHVRLSKDIQRIKNMLMSKLAELSALSSVEKPIFTPEQMMGLAELWARDVLDNNPYLLARPVYNLDGSIAQLGPIGYTKPPQIPPALAALMQLVDVDIGDLLGNQQAGEELQNNVSGVAVELVQNKLDMQTFIYMSNMKKSIKWAAKVWLSMKKDVTVQENRKMKTINNAGKISSIEVMRPVIDEETGEQLFENNIQKADFDVVATIGPMSSSRRAATVRALTGMMQISQDPETQQVLGAMAMTNMEGEGIGDARDFFRAKLLRLGAVKPTEDEEKELAKEQQNQKPDPNAEFLQASARKADAETVKTQADTEQSVAKTDQVRVDTIAAIAAIDQTETAHSIATIQAIEQSMGLNNQSVK